MKIEIPQLKKTLHVEKSSNLLTVLVKERIPIAHSCAGEGVCGTCTLYISGDKIPQESSLEKRLKQKQRKGLSSKNCRIACLIQIPESSKTWVLRSDYW